MENITGWKSVYHEGFDSSVIMNLVSSKNITVCKIETNKPITLQSHAHKNEQISFIIEGEVLVKYGDKERQLKKGDICIIPSDVIH